MKKEYKEPSKILIVSRLEYLLDEYLSEYSTIKDRLCYLKGRIEEHEINNEFGVSYEVHTRELLKYVIKEQDYSLFIKELRQILCQEVEITL